MRHIPDAEGDCVGVECWRPVTAAPPRRRVIQVIARSSLALARLTPSPTMSALISQTVMCASPPRARARSAMRNAMSPVPPATSSTLPARARVQPFDHRVLPKAVYACGHQIVHQVIFAGDGRKDLAHEAFLFGLRHVAKSETGGGVSSHVRKNSRCGFHGLPSSAATLMDSPCPNCPKLRPSARAFARLWRGASSSMCETRRGDLRIPFPNDFVKRLTGQTVKRLWRRAKYLMAELDGGETLVIHLGMSGRIAVYADGKERKLGKFLYPAAPPDAGKGKHDHVVMRDRRAGADRLHRPSPLWPHDIDRHRQDRRTSSVQGPWRRTFVGRIRRGLSDEGAERQEDADQVRPARPARDCGPRQHLCLRGAVPIRHFAEAACEIAFARAHRAARQRDQSGAQGGNHRRRFVLARSPPHGRRDGLFPENRFSSTTARASRAGRKDCKGTIKRIVQAGRSTFYCPSCQK